MNSRVGIIVVALWLCSCGQNFNSISIADNITNPNKDTLIRFKKFLQKFKMLKLPFEANISCFDPDTLLCKRLDPPNDSLFVTAEMGISIGILPDTADFYVVIYGEAAACWLPMLAVFSKTGEVLSSAQISTGCGGDCGYTCSDSLVIQSLTDIKETYIQESFVCDSLGKETPGTWERTVDIFKFAVDKKGMINKTSTHTSQKR